mgnify:FL=1
MDFTAGDWSKVDNPNGGEAFVNPNVSTDEPSIEAATSLEPGEVESSGWDAVEESLNAPEASGVEKVGIDFENGVVDVHDSSGRATYLLAAVGDKGEFSVIDDRGNVSTSEVRAMPLKHHVAITEAILGSASFETDATRIDLGFHDSYTDMYTDVMRSGSYEALGGDVVFDFDNVDGVPALKNNDKAKKFIDQLDDIAEFYRDFEQDYSLTDETVDPDIPVRPERKSNNNGLGSGYKFTLAGSDNDGNIVISREYGGSDTIELDVMAFGNHKGDTRLY